MTESDCVAELIKLYCELNQKTIIYEDNYNERFYFRNKKIKTDNLIYAFSEISIDMFKNNEFAKDIELLITRYGKHKKMITKLSAWDIQNIVFLSVKNSNDYRQADKICSLERLVHLYRQYENEHSYLTSVKTTTDYNVFHLILGMTAEQFQFQRLDGYLKDLIEIIIFF